MGRENVSPRIRRNKQVQTKVEDEERRRDHLHSSARIRVVDVLVVELRSHSLVTRTAYHSLEPTEDTHAYLGDVREEDQHTESKVNEL